MFKLVGIAVICALFNPGCAVDLIGGSDETGGSGPGGGPGAGVGGGGYGGGQGALACKHVDLVFAVDDSGSMREEMDSMRNTIFPAFARQLITIGAGLDDYRVGVVDACPQPSVFNTRGEAGACNFSSNQSWMDSQSPRLVEEFGCVGDIYSDDVACSGDNDDEQPASAAARALENGDNGAFLRDDALLVVVAITDEDETPIPAASPQAIYDRLVAVKGDVRRMVFLGIGGASACDGVYGSAEHAQNLMGVTDHFIDQDRGVFWDLCRGRLEDGLAAAMQVIEQACDDLPDVLCTEFSPDGITPDCYDQPPPAPTPEEPPPEDYPPVI